MITIKSEQKFQIVVRVLLVALGYKDVGDSQLSGNFVINEDKRTFYRYTTESSCNWPTYTFPQDCNGIIQRLSTEEVTIVLHAGETEFKFPVTREWITNLYEKYCRYEKHP